MPGRAEAMAAALREVLRLTPFNDARARSGGSSGGGGGGGSGELQGQQEQGQGPGQEEEQEQEEEQQGPWLNASARWLLMSGAAPRSESAVGCAGPGSTI